ncbi:unnamed protein product, partial [Amoebophrya sp. A120]
AAPALWRKGTWTVLLVHKLFRLVMERAQLTASNGATRDSSSVRASWQGIEKMKKSSSFQLVGDIAQIRSTTLNLSCQQALLFVGEVSSFYAACVRVR